MSKKMLSGLQIDNDVFPVGYVMFDHFPCSHHFFTRARVKRALLDLELFIICAEQANREQVINDETTKPILQALLDSSQDTEFNKIKAEIAYNMVYLGFSYLRDIEYEDLTLSHERTIEEAIDLADYLSRIIPISE